MVNEILASKNDYVTRILPSQLTGAEGWEPLPLAHCLSAYLDIVLEARGYGWIRADLEVPLEPVEALGRPVPSGLEDIVPYGSEPDILIYPGPGAFPYGSGWRLIRKIGLDVLKALGPLAGHDAASLISCYFIESEYRGRADMDETPYLASVIYEYAPTYDL